MPADTLPIARKLSLAGRVLASAAAVVAAVLVVHWSRQIALGVPDAYRGQNRGGLLLSLAILAGSTGNLVGKPYLRLALSIVSMAFLAMTVYFLGWLSS